MLKVYFARGMTGRVASEVVEEAGFDKWYAEKYGITVLCPVVTEQVQASEQPILASKQQMDEFWRRDKEMIREAHVVFNLSPHMPSLGVIREHGYARYHLWKKTISVFPLGKMPREGAVCHYEDDYVCDTLQSAIEEAFKTHGTRWKRLKWRIGVFRKSWLKAVFYRTLEWFK